MIAQCKHLSSLKKADSYILDSTANFSACILLKQAINRVLSVGAKYGILNNSRVCV